MQILQSCRDYQGEPHKFYFEVLKIKKINKNANLKVPLMCIPLAHLNFSILKCKYILSRREHMSGIRTPHSFKIFSSYPHVYLLNQPFYRQQKWHNQATIQNGTQIICASGRGTISNLDTTYMLGLASVDPGMQNSTQTPCFASHYCSQNFVQEVIDLFRISTSGLEIHLYSRGWFKTIKIVQI